MRLAPALFAVLTLTSAVAASAAELDQHGRAHTWQGPSETYTVIDFAAAWCAPCWRTLPKLEELATRATAVRFLIVSVDDAVSGRDRLVEELELTLPVLWDENAAIAEHYAPEAMPATIVLAPDGRVVHRHTGSDGGDWDDFERFVLDLDPGDTSAAR